MMKTFLHDHFFPLARYGAIATLAFVTNFSLLYVLVGWLKMNATLSSAISFLVATKVNYFAQYRWTFSSDVLHKKAMIRYWLIVSFTTLLNIGLFWILTRLLGLWYIYAQFASVCVVFTINFSLHRAFTFRSSSIEPPI